MIIEYKLAFCTTCKDKREVKKEIIIPICKRCLEEMIILENDKI